MSHFIHFGRLGSERLEYNVLESIACKSKECRSIVRDESSVYFNVTAKHV